MSEKSTYTLVLYYSNANAQSMRVRVSLSEFLSENYEWANVKVKEVDFEENKEQAHEAGVFGTPVMLVYKNNLLINRYFGEVSVNELTSFIKHDM